MNINVHLQIMAYKILNIISSTISDDCKEYINLKVLYVIFYLQVCVECTNNRAMLAPVARPAGVSKTQKTY